MPPFPQNSFSCISVIFFFGRVLSDHKHYILLQLKFLHSATSVYLVTNVTVVSQDVAFTTTHVGFSSCLFVVYHSEHAHLIKEGWIGCLWVMSMCQDAINLTYSHKWAANHTTNPKCDLMQMLYMQLLALNLIIKGLNRE